MKLRILKWANVIPKSLKVGGRRLKVREKVEYATLLALKMKAPQARECRQPLDAGKRQGNIFSLKVSRRNTTLPIP